MNRVKWYVSVVIMFFCVLPSAGKSTPTLIANKIANIDIIDVEDIEVCNANRVDCQPMTCMDQCIKHGEDPMECPLYCNSET